MQGFRFAYVYHGYRISGAIVFIFLDLFLLTLHRPIDIVHIDMLADEGGKLVVLRLLEGFVIEGSSGGGGVETCG